jgi:hypothetical protein
MRTHKGYGRLLVLATLCAAPLSFAQVGKIAVLQGSATRTPKGGTATPLAVGAGIELEDTLDVVKGGNLKLELNDQSVIMIGGGSRLFIEKADFEGQERKGFSAKLGFGKIWSKVTKMLSGSDAKFQVSTDRAVAGVRGTVFRIDAVALVKGTKPKTTVRVQEGVVRVAKQDKGPRREVPGPQEINAQQWEKKFVELQANQQVSVGEELGQVVPYEDAAKKDAFAQFVDQND